MCGSTDRPSLWDGTSKTLFERALATDAENVPALEGLARTLTSIFWRDRGSFSGGIPEDPTGDLARAEEMIDRALALQPQNSSAHEAKGLMLSAKRQWPAAIAEEEAAIADDSNNYAIG